MGMYNLYCGSTLCATSVDRNKFYTSLFMFNNIFLRKCIIETPVSFFRVYNSDGKALIFEECDRNGERIMVGENDFVVKFLKL